MPTSVALRTESFYLSFAVKNGVFPNDSLCLIRNVSIDLSKTVSGSRTNRTVTPGRQIKDIGAEEDRLSVMPLPKLTLISKTLDLTVSASASSWEASQ
jgi:hypothetical protein